MDLSSTRIDRLDMEFIAIDNAIAKMRYLGFSPRHDTFAGHCAAFGRMLSDELVLGERFLKHKSW